MSPFTTRSAVLWAWAVVAWVLGDLLTTLPMFVDPRVVELSPVAGGVAQATGLHGLIAAKVLILAVAAFAYYLDPPGIRDGIPAALALVGTLAVAWNLRVLIILYL